MNCASYTLMFSIFVAEISFAPSVKNQYEETCKESSVLQNFLVQELKTAYCVSEFSVESNIGSVCSLSAEVLGKIQSGYSIAKLAPLQPLYTSYGIF